MKSATKAIIAFLTLFAAGSAQAELVEIQSVEGTVVIPHHVAVKLLNSQELVFNKDTGLFEFHVKQNTTVGNMASKSSRPGVEEVDLDQIEESLATGYKTIYQ